jgi:hypothetical protein
MPSASGVLRGSLPWLAISWVVLQAGMTESSPSPAAPTPACLRNVLRFSVMPAGSRDPGLEDKPKRQQFTALDTGGRNPIAGCVREQRH